MPNHYPEHIFFRRILSAKVNDLAHFFGDIKRVSEVPLLLFLKWKKINIGIIKTKNWSIFRNIASYFVHTSAKGYLYSKYYFITVKKRNLSFIFKKICIIFEHILFKLSGYEILKFRKYQDFFFFFF